MKKTSYYYLLLLLSFSLLPGCFLFGSDDDQPAPQPIPPLAQLPPITSEGRGTFGCLVNGEAFVSYYPRAFADFSTNISIDLSGNISDPTSSIILTIMGYQGQEQVFSDSTAFLQYKAVFENSSYCDYRPNEKVRGSIDIRTFNPSDEFISGTFEYMAVNDNCDTLCITNGRFDLPLVW